MCLSWSHSYSFSNFSSSEPFQLPLWGVSKDLACSHSHFVHQQPARETPRPLRNEGVIDSDREQAASPRPCHRLRDHNFDFNRTRNVHDYSEATWDAKMKPWKRIYIKWLFVFTTSGLTPRPKMLVYMCLQSQADQTRSGSLGGGATCPFSLDFCVLEHGNVPQNTWMIYPQE